MKSFTATILTVILVLGACSVREERAGCPCRLEIDLTLFSEYTARAAVAIWNGADAWQETIPVSESYVRNIRKGEVFSSVWSGQREGQMSGPRLVMPPRAEPDSLRVFNTRLDCQEETFRIKAVPHKQFCRVTLRVIRDEGMPYPYQFYVESDCCGIDLQDLSPVTGDHVFPVREQPDGIFAFSLLRHRPASDIVLAIYDERKQADALPLGDWMRKAGYDWEAEDLSDISFTVDYARQRVGIALSDWQEGQILQLEI